MADLEYDVTNGVGTILLNRPRRKNAFTLTTIDDGAAVPREARTDDAVRCLVLTGAGDGFCSREAFAAFVDKRPGVYRGR